MNNKHKKIICLSIVLMFFISFFLVILYNFNNIEVKNYGDLDLSKNYLYNNKSYDFRLDDFYDDDELTKIFTDAEFQIEAFEGNDWTGTISSDTFFNVDNTEIRYGDPANINMIKGTTDSADNMRVNDGLFTNFTSESSGTAPTPNTTAYESPQQFGEFGFEYGSGGAVGELETNDADYARIDAGEFLQTEKYLGYIVPDGDWYTNWNEGDATPHWSKLDEATGDMDGDGGNIRESSGVWERLRFSSLVIPANCKVSKLIVKFLVKKEAANTSTTLQYRMNYPSGYNYHIPTENYTWIGDGFTGLSITQAQLDSFYVEVKPYLIGSIHGWLDIEAIYVDVYRREVRYYSRFNVEWTADNIIETFDYDYRTTIAIGCKLYIWNWVTTAWLTLEDNTDTVWHTDSYILTDPYISGNSIRIYFSTLLTTTTDFDMELDQIALGYTVEGDAGDMSNQIEMTIKFPYINHDDVLTMDVSSLQRTNTSQAISFSILDHDTGIYEQISNSSDIAFTEKRYNTDHPERFISLNEVVMLKWTGVNTTDAFELHIDYLYIQTYHMVDLVHSKSFDTDGIYRYRWAVLTSTQSDFTEWVEFEVIEPVIDYTTIITAVIYLLIILSSILIFIGIFNVIQTRRCADVLVKSVSGNNKAKCFKPMSKWKIDWKKIKEMYLQIGLVVIGVLIIIICILFGLSFIR